MLTRSFLIGAFVLGLGLQPLKGQRASSPRSDNSRARPAPSAISMPYSNMAWRGTVTVTADEIFEQVANDKPGITYHPTHYPFDQLEYCSFYDNRPESIGPPSYFGATVAGRRIAYHGYGPSLWIIVQGRDGRYNGFAIPSDSAGAFYQAAKTFGRGCGPSTPEIRGPRSAK